MKCKHENGWVVKEEFVVSDGDNENIIVDCECNNLNCKERIKLKFDIINVELAKNEN